jgi:hypothetical protein
MSFGGKIEKEGREKRGKPERKGRKRGKNNAKKGVHRVNFGISRKNNIFEGAWGGYDFWIDTQIFAMV